MSAQSFGLPAGQAPEPAAATLSGMGLAGLGWYFGKARLRRRFRSRLTTSGSVGSLVLVEPREGVSVEALQEQVYLGCKRTADIVLASLALILLSPLLLALAIAVRVDSPGAVFFRQERLSEGRRKFKLLKFRSMCADADRVLEENQDLQEQFQKLFKLKDDPRVTRVGAFLRKTSMDELPQLINVLKGDISLVGPRPIVESECEKYWPFEDRLFSVRPGMTGLWQVSGRNDTSYEERVRLDMRYIAERSLLKDLHILAVTLPALLKRDNGAY